MPPRVLQTEKLTKYFHTPQKFRVLSDISLTVEKGESISIMGKSGCGKSTLLYLLATLDTDYEGRIYINEEQVTGLNEQALARFRNRHIGFVFQFHYLLPEFSVLENIMIPALKSGLWKESDIKEKAMEKLRQMDLANHAASVAGKLSGGQQQRVAIARALINDPDIIFADEPTGNLDSANTGIISDIFHQLQQQGNTLVIVTHDDDFAKRSNRIVKMVDGKIA